MNVDLYRPVSTCTGRVDDCLCQAPHCRSRTRRSAWLHLYRPISTYIRPISIQVAGDLYRLVSAPLRGPDTGRYRSPSAHRGPDTTAHPRRSRSSGPSGDVLALSHYGQAPRGLKAVKRLLDLYRESATCIGAGAGRYRSSELRAAHWQLRRRDRSQHGVVIRVVKAGMEGRPVPERLSRRPA